jgi:hypothetical protein
LIGINGNGFRSGLGQRVERLIKMGGRSWAPLNRWRSRFAKVAAPMGLAAVVLLCAAWANPTTNWEEENDMKTIQQNWKRAIATLSLFTALQTTGEPAHAAEMTARPSAGSEVGITTAQAEDLAAARTTRESDRAASLLQDARLLMEMGKLDEAQAIVESVLRDYPAHPHALRLSNQLPKGDSPPTVPAPDPEMKAFLDNLAAMEPELLRRYGLEPRQRSTGMHPEMMRRYGLSPAPSAVRAPSGGKQRVETKLGIILDEVHYDGVPLFEVVKDLQERVARHDEQGINFLISNVPSSVPVTVDPVTGMQIYAPRSEVPDALIRFTLPLRHVRLRDVLDAVVRVSDQPIKYSVEDFGVVFAPDPEGQAFYPAAHASFMPASTLLQARTFTVDTNLFLPGLESAFGVNVRSDTTDRVKQSRATQQALRNLFTQLGVNFDRPEKSVFYNELTGIVMARATPEELEIIQAAIETLGGAASAHKGAYGGGYGGR